MRYKFDKEERVTSRKEMDLLFRKGSKIGNAPIKIFFLAKEETNLDKFRNRILIAVPKRYLKKAHERNLIKRRIREIYRKNKLEIIKFFNLKAEESLVLAVVYSTNKLLNYNELEGELFKLLKIKTHKH